MIGVRRFLGGGGLAAAPPQSEPAPASSLPTPMSPPSGSTTMKSTPVPAQRSRQYSDDDSSPDAGSRFATQTNQQPKSSFYQTKDSRQWQGSARDSDGQRSSSFSSRSRSPSLVSHANLRSRPSSPPRAGPSSFRPPLPSNIKTNGTGMDPRASPATSNPLTSSSLTWRHANTPLNMKDELLMSLLASQAVVDSKDSEILTADDVEDMKREYSHISSRTVQAARKLATETRIRDAAVKLKSLSSSNTPADPNADQIVHANRKVEAAQQELYQLSERSNEIYRRLLEHRAGILSFSVRSLEKRAAVAMGAASSTDTDSESSTVLSGEMSPASTTATSLSAAPIKKFDGAHLFAGHADAFVPSMTSPSRVRETEDRLNAANDALEAMRKRQAEVEHELMMLSLEKSQVETKMAQDLQNAQDLAHDLQADADRVGTLEAQVQDLQSRNAENNQTILQLRAELMAKEAESKRLLEERRAWEEEKTSLRQSLAEHQASTSEELIVAREGLKTLCRQNRVDVPPNDTKLSSYISALESHLANTEGMSLGAPTKGAYATRITSPLAPAPRRGSGDDVDDSVTAILKPLWAILPSVEARASKLGNNGRSGARSPKLSNGRKTPESPAMVSLSELDVRSLKALYDPKGNYQSPAVQGDFSLEDFANRVHALVQDDRALVERLIRFAQAHDLLKNNAERAQKLAQDSSMGLQTYQQQVKTLEERNQALTAAQASLMDEIDDIHIAMDRLEDQKRVLEEQAAEQAKTCKELSDANDALSAKTLALADESVAKPDRVMELEKQIADLNKRLVDANDELDRTRTAESLQRVTLLDELNSLQDENANLRNQLRQRPPAGK